MLAHVLCNGLKLLHPIMPFITEELWQHLPHTGDRIGASAWPTSADGRRDVTAASDMSRLLEFSKAVRDLRAIPQVKYRDLSEVHVASDDDAFLQLANRESGIVRTMGRVGTLVAMRAGDGKPKHALSRRVGTLEVLLPVDATFIDKERAALRGQIEKTQTEIDALQRKLASGGFREKAPAAVVQKEEARLHELREHLRTLLQRLESLGDD